MHHCVQAMAEDRIRELSTDAQRTGPIATIAVRDAVNQEREGEMKANFETFLIAMGRRAKRRVQLMRDARSMSSPLSIGRFSSGMERTGPSAEKERIGRVSTGM